MTNIELFEFSRTQPSPLIDPYYNKGKVVITKTKDECNELMIANRKLIELITVFNYLCIENGKTEQDKEIVDIVDKVIKILDTVDGINYSAFSQFFMVYNAAYSSYLQFHADKKRKFIFDMLRLYCVERHSMYQSHGYTDSILQVLSDNYSHKRNSKTSIVKITDTLESLGIFHFDGSYDLDGSVNFYILPDKGDDYVFYGFKSKYSVVMKSSVHEQGKLPDVLIKIRDNYYIVEAKMMKGSGGGQDKQLVEIINFIRFSENTDKIHYVTYLDGEYLDLLFAEKQAPKIQKQYDDIVNCLNKNPNNYFVTPEGFRRLMQDSI